MFENVKLLLSIPDKQTEEIIAYNEIIDYIEQQDNETEGPERLWKFRAIKTHQGPLESHDKDYKGSTYNVLVEWESGESTYEPLDMIARDDPVTCAVYAKENDLLDTPGWKRFRRMARRSNR